MAIPKSIILLFPFNLENFEMKTSFCHLNIKKNRVTLQDGMNSIPLFFAPMQFSFHTCSCHTVSKASLKADLTSCE